jgi:hypothetical protein
MQDLLQYIDLDYYRSAQLLIARAEIAQLRGQSLVLECTETQCKILGEASRPLDQTAHAASSVPSGATQINSSRCGDLDH